MKVVLLGGPRDGEVVEVEEGTSSFSARGYVAASPFGPVQAGLVRQPIQVFRWQANGLKNRDGRPVFVLVESRVVS